MSDVNGHERIILALDVEGQAEAVRVLERVNALVGYVKLGYRHLLLSEPDGPLGQILRLTEGRLMADLKLADIESTTLAAFERIAPFRPAFVTVHASLALKTLSKLVDRAEAVGTKVLAVTVLTDLDDEDAAAIYGCSIQEAVLRLAGRAYNCGVRGIVCSPADLLVLQAESWSRDMLRVTPGVRPFWAGGDDQVRVTTPGQAIINTATHVVVGRPIYAPPSGLASMQAAILIAEEIGQALTTIQSA